MADPNESNETGSDAARPPHRPPGFRIGNVLKVVVPLALLGLGGVVFVGYFDGLNLLSSMTDPVLVSASGQVMYQGKPLTDAQVTTRHTGGKVKGAIGWTDDQGRFTLQTDINGYVDGAYAGEHQVAVTAYHVSNAIGSPPLKTPQIYAALDTTPLRIVVSPVAEENKYDFNLEGDPPPRPSADVGGGGRGPVGGGGFDPEAIVGRVFENFDKDGDGKLSDEEMQAIAADRVERIRGADANEDGVVSRDELLQAFSAPRPAE